MTHLVSFPAGIDEINAAPEAAFVTAFADIAEHAPWVARGAARQRPFADRGALVAAFVATMRQATHKQQSDLLLAHPDLAGRAALAGELTDDSTREQAGVGLDSLTGEEFDRFTRLNREYRGRFGIPFIFAVRGATKADILAAFEERMSGSQEDEFRIALDQVANIIRFRLEDRVVARSG